MQEIVTRTARYHIGDDGLVRVASLRGAEETLADAMENVRAVTTLLDGRRGSMLCDSRLLKSMDREARAYYARPEMGQVLSAMAIIVASPVTRMIVNFFMTLNKPHFPTRFFTSESEALVWLDGVVGRKAT